MKRAIPVVALLLSLCGVARGDQAKALDPKAVGEDIKKLEGTWHTGKKAAVKWNVWIVPFYLDGRLTGAYLVAGVDSKPKLAISERLRAGDFEQEGKRRVITLRNQKRLEDAPLTALGYRFDGETLLLSVSEGKLEGEHRLERFKADKVRKDGPGTLDPKAVEEDVKQMEGIWKTDPKAVVQMELVITESLGGKSNGAVIGGTIGPKPKDKFIGPAPSISFWQDGKKRGLRVERPFDSDAKVWGFEYRIDGDSLVITVTDGEAKGEYKLKRSGGQK
jgi:hypothetical protein